MDPTPRPSRAVVSSGPSWTSTGPADPLSLLPLLPMLHTHYMHAAPC